MVFNITNLYRVGLSYKEVEDFANAYSQQSEFYVTSSTKLIAARSQIEKITGLKVLTAEEGTKLLVNESSKRKFNGIYWSTSGEKQENS